MLHQLCVLVKHEYEATEDRPSDLQEKCRELVPGSKAVSPVAERSLFSSMQCIAVAARLAKMMNR